MLLEISLKNSLSLKWPFSLTWSPYVLELSLLTYIRSTFSICVHISLLLLMFGKAWLALEVPHARRYILKGITVKSGTIYGFHFQLITHI